MRVLRPACDRCGELLKDWEIKEVKITFDGRKHNAELCETCRDIVEDLIKDAISLYKQTEIEAEKDVLPKYIKGSLTAAQKTIVWELHKEGKSIQDISFITNKHPNSIKAYLVKRVSYNPDSVKEIKEEEVSNNIVIPTTLKDKKAEVVIITPDVARVNGELVDLARIRFRRKSGWNDECIARELNIKREYIRDIVIAYNRFIEAKKSEK